MPIKKDILTQIENAEVSQRTKTALAATGLEGADLALATVAMTCMETVTANYGDKDPGAMYDTFATATNWPIPVAEVEAKPAEPEMSLEGLDPAMKKFVEDKIEASDKKAKEEAKVAKAAVDELLEDKAKAARERFEVKAEALNGLPIESEKLVDLLVNLSTKAPEELGQIEAIFDKLNASHDASTAMNEIGSSAEGDQDAKATANKTIKDAMATLMAGDPKMKKEQAFLAACKTHTQSYRDLGPDGLTE